MNTLPIQLRIDPSFFEEELRSDYRVSGSMKEVWAVELDLLYRLDRLCEKHSLRHCIAYGTLIGAARHGGFIPWDDDLDVFMPREDYDRLCNIAPKELEEPYFFQSEKTDYGIARSFARLRNSATTGIQKMEDSSYIRYNQGIFIDIFPLDRVPINAEERKNYGNRILSLRNKAIALSSWTTRYCPKLTSNPVKKALAPFFSKLFYAFKIPNPYIHKIEKESLRYRDRKDTLLCLLWWYDPNRECLYKPEWFEHYREIPFEMLSTLAPVEYSDVLEVDYGDWRIPVQTPNSHGDMRFDARKSYKE